jgi:hypothetical protein
VTTYAQVIHRTRARLMTSQREPINTLAATIDADDTTVTFTNPVNFHDGIRLSIDLEDMHVVDVAQSGTSATVIRGVDGSTAAAHTAGVIAHINPVWTNWQISLGVNDELHALSSPTNGLFRIRTVDFDYQPAVAGYNLASLEDYLDIWRVRYDTPGPTNDWPVIPRSMWRVDRAADTTDFASGTALILSAGGFPGQKVRVSYKATFDTLTAVADDVETVSGLHAQAHDILSLGAALRLLSGTEAQRAYTTTQADTRYASEVPPRTATGALIPLIEQRQERIAEEQARLARQYPESL